jgi:cysteine-rich repeat protein
MPRPRSFARADALVVLLLMQLGCAGEEGPPAPREPIIMAFEASSLAVTPGDPVALSWRVEHADTVKIEVVGGRPLLERGEASGQVVSAPILEPTTFVLRATSAAGEAMQRLVVELAQPGAVSIEQLAIRPMQIAPDGQATLVYAARNATRVRLMVIDGPILLDSTTALEGALEVSAAVSTSYALIADGEGGPEVSTVTLLVEGTPRIDRFVADPPTIEGGQSATLRWEVADAASVSVATADRRTIFEGEGASGSVTVTPGSSERYVLSARSSLGQEVRAMTMVAIARGARIERFGASPTRVDFGDRAVLEWAASSAPAGVDLFAGERMLVRGAAQVGQLTVTATVTTTYTLIARSPDGDASALATVAVSPSAPRVLAFEGPPSPAVADELGTLRWDVVGAAEVRLLDPTGAVLTATRTWSGGWPFVLEDGERVFTLIAANPNGVTRATVRVRALHRPTIEAFAVAPEVLVGAEALPSFAWRVSEGASVTLSRDGAAVPGFPRGSSGLWTDPRPVTGVARFTLTATNALGRAEAEVSVLRAIAVPDAGPDPGSALLLAGSEAAVTEELLGADVDVYAVTVPAGGGLRASTSLDGVRCGFDSVLTLYAPDGVTVLGEDDDGGLEGGCSRLEPRRDRFARDLLAGTYFVAVRGRGGGGRYALRVEAVAPRCGNALIERRAGEVCDDGNAAAGDGCSASCAIEPRAELRGPGGGPVVVRGAIVRLGERAHHRLSLSAPTTLAVRSSVPSPGRCAEGAARLLLTLLDASGREVGRADAGDGCPRIQADVESWARVPAGTYALVVEERDGDALVPAYALELELRPSGCGDGALEDGEPCDDGNLASGDGCSSRCAREVSAVLTGAALAPQTVPLSLPSAGASAWVRLELLATVAVVAETFAPRSSSCAVADTVLELLAADGRTVLARDDQGGMGRCSRLDGLRLAALRLPAGTYYLRVTEGGGDTALPALELVVEAIAAGVCGDGVREPERGEACDDGGTASGDGCSPACALETPRLSGEAPPPIEGRLAAGAVDRYELEVAVPGAIVIAQVGTAALGDCGSGSARPVLRLLDFGGAERATNLGGAACGPIDGRRTAAARLPPGRYFVSVEELGRDEALEPYRLQIELRPLLACGNEVVEPAVQEECEVGDPAAPGPCDAGCRLQTVAELTGPGPADRVVRQGVAASRAVERVRLTLAAPAVIVARVRALDGTDCERAPPLGLELWDSTSRRLVMAYGGGDGTFACAAIDGALERAARVPAGSYLLEVKGAGGAALPDYELAVEARPERCGDGLLAPANGETCDDGNALGDDGCDARCVRERGDFRAELEPDDRPEAAMELGVLGLGPVHVVGAARAFGDRDLFRFTLASPAWVRVEVEAEGGASMPCALRGALSLFEGQPLRLDAQTAREEPTLRALDAPITRCPRLGGDPAGQLLAAGTYLAQLSTAAGAPASEGYVLRFEAR